MQTPARSQGGPFRVRSVERSFPFKQLVIAKNADRFLVFRPERYLAAAFWADRDELLAHIDPYADRIFPFRR